MPAEELITPLGWEMIRSIPPIMQGDPTIRAILHCYAKEWERIDAAIDRLIRQLFPHTADELGLPLWEAQFRLTVNPAGRGVPERQQLVLSYYRSVRNSGSGERWEENVESLLGANWEYLEWDPDNPSSPPPDTIRVMVPYPPSSGNYAAARAFIRSQLPANQDLNLVYVGGFILDQGELDQQPLS